MFTQVGQEEMFGGLFIGGNGDEMDGKSFLPAGEILGYGFYLVLAMGAPGAPEADEVYFSFLDSLREGDGFGCTHLPYEDRRQLLSVHCVEQEYSYYGCE